MYDLKQFFNYKPIYTKKEIDDFFEKQLKQPVIEYLGEKAGEQLQKAYDYAYKLHGDEKRLSGEPYIVHPVYVAKYLLLIKPGIIALQAALLHDVIEDTPVTGDDILKDFGPEVAFLCLGLEKVGRVRYQGEDRQLETLKKTFLAMGQDIRVILVKLADRIHNIQTIKYHPQRDKQIRISTETIKIFAPIAKRLGIEIFQLYLENGAFANLEPKEFERIYSYLQKNYYNLDINKIALKLKTNLLKNNIKVESIKGRVKSPYKIYLKFDKYGTNDIKQIKDILAFRVVVKDEQNCYNSLGVIHSVYKPIIKKIKDYIALPKPNGYQSLHTTVLGLYKTDVEIQIRTYDMDQLAEYGIAAHFLYKEKGSNNINNVGQKHINWVNDLKTIADEYKEDKAENKHFFNVLSIDFLSKSVFAYTPNGKVIEIPRGGSVLDFAFRVHSDIGLRFKSAFVNGKIVPIHHKLRNGDIVEIKTFKNQYSVKKSWLDYVISPTSKSKIRSHINLQEHEQQLILGKQILNDELSKINLPLLGGKEDQISKTLSEKEIEKNLINIFNKNISASKFIKTVYINCNFNESNKKEIKKDVSKDSSKENVGEKRVVIDDSLLFKYSLCPDCNPSIEEQIIGKVSNEGIKVHNISCKALNSVNCNKLVNAHWYKIEPSYYNINIRFDLTGFESNIMQILNYIQSLNIKIPQINTVMEKNKIYLDVQFKTKLTSTICFVNSNLKPKKGELFESYKINFIK